MGLSYHVCVGDLLLGRVPVGVRCRAVIWEELLQSSEGSVRLGLLLIGASAFELLPIHLHLTDREGKEVMAPSETDSRTLMYLCLWEKQWANGL